jgi:histidinol-phosphatase (PHP family)
MLSNFHTHTIYCDGKSTAEEIVRSAIKKGFDAIGFSGHGFTDHDLSYCMKDTVKYLSEVRELAKEYSDRIEVYAGVEEDASFLLDRTEYDYIIGSFHYVKKNGVYHAIDCSMEGFNKCLEVFEGDHITMAKTYFDEFCTYINSRRPDIVGHFDLLTKYDEKNDFSYSEDPEYNRLAEAYIESVADTGCIFEVNTGAISRGYRTNPYPAENLLYVLKKHGTDLILNSDSHFYDTIDCNFNETRAFLKDMGFKTLMTMSNGEFIRYQI